MGTGTILKPAHPRSCGADTSGSVRRSVADGSSPLVRGGPSVEVGGVCGRRLIPARAGRTAMRLFLKWWDTAHPRSCGADLTQAVDGASDAGSSPLVRGGPIPACPAHPPTRLIPARAGRTGRGCRRQSTAPAHPRSCGADVSHLCAALGLYGSSPLVRGGRDQPGPHPPRGRLIPARAGRTSHGRPVRHRAEAHPRSCGADSAHQQDTARESGSSPLVRGGPDGFIKR